MRWFASPLAGNKDWPAKVREDAITLLGKLGEGADDSTAFDCLFAVIKSGEENRLWQVAAFSIVRHIRLHEKRRKVVEDFLATEKDKTLVQALRDAVRNGIEKDDDDSRKK